MSSIHEDVAFLDYATYAASKGGMRMFTRTVCQELAPHGITVNDIAPGAIATPINKRTLGDGELLHELAGVIPAGRLGEPDEVAAAGRLPRLRRGRLRHRQHVLHRRRHDPLEQGAVRLSAEWPIPRASSSRTLAARGHEPHAAEHVRHAALRPRATAGDVEHWYVTIQQG